MCFKKIIDWLKGTGNDDADNDDNEEQSHSEILTALRAEVGEDCHIYLSDGLYKAMDKQIMIDFLEKDNTDKYNYVTEFFDCDDFSNRLYGQFSTPEYAGYPFGILWVFFKNKSGGHAINIFVDNELTVWVVEPQTDDIFRIPDNWEPALIVM